MAHEVSSQPCHSVILPGCAVLLLLLFSLPLPLMFSHRYIRRYNPYLKQPSVLSQDQRTKANCRGFIFHLLFPTIIINWLLSSNIWYEYIWRCIYWHILCSLTWVMFVLLYFLTFHRSPLFLYAGCLTVASSDSFGRAFYQSQLPTIKVSKKQELMLTEPAHIACVKENGVISCRGKEIMSLIWVAASASPSVLVELCGIKALFQTNARAGQHALGSYVSIGSFTGCCWRAFWRDISSKSSAHFWHKHELHAKTSPSANEDRDFPLQCTWLQGMCTLPTLV